VSSTTKREMRGEKRVESFTTSMIQLPDFWSLPGKREWKRQRSREAKQEFSPLGQKKAAPSEGPGGDEKTRKRKKGGESNEGGFFGAFCAQGKGKRRKRGRRNQNWGEHPWRLSGCKEGEG